MFYLTMISWFLFNILFATNKYICQGVVQLIFNTHAFMFCGSRVNIGGKSKYLVEEQTWLITVHLGLQDGPYSLTLIPGMLTMKAALTNS